MIPFSTSFTLTTDNVVAAYNNDVKAPALVAAKDVQADDFAKLCKKIFRSFCERKRVCSIRKRSCKN